MTSFHLAAVIIFRAIARAVSQIVTRHTVTSVFLFMRTCVCRISNMPKYKFSMHLQIFNGMLPSLQQEIRPYVNGFPSGCSDTSGQRPLEISTQLVSTSLDK